MDKATPSTSSAAASYAGAISLEDAACSDGAASSAPATSKLGSRLSVSFQIGF